MSRAPSAETQLRSERRITKLLRSQLAETAKQLTEYRWLASKAEADAAEWKKRFDVLLSREPSPATEGKHE
jgi:hypothetical protein